MLEVSAVGGRNWDDKFDVEIEQPVLAGIDDEIEIEAAHDDGLGKQRNGGCGFHSSRPGDSCISGKRTKRVGAALPAAPPAIDIN
jgi:hypothetical protein